MPRPRFLPHACIVALMLAAPATAGASDARQPSRGRPRPPAPAPTRPEPATRIPEPDTIGLFLLGAAGLVVGRRLSHSRRDTPDA